MRTALTFLFASLFVVACIATTPLSKGTEAPTETQSAILGGASQPTAALPPTESLPVRPPAGKPCGDGVCQGPENAQNCPTDCARSSSPSANQAKAETFTVTNPASGAALYAAVFYPGSWDGQNRLSALVLVPGGSSDSGSFLRLSPGGSTVDILNQAGYAAVVFDPDGRGQSGGTENYNGFIHQDGLAEVIRLAATLPGIDPNQIGLVTYSYGISMSAGALARHPDLSIRFLIDWEGPANRDDTGGCDGARLGHLKGLASCSDEAFWSEREASTFIAQIHIPYQRIQSEKDHVQPDNIHAILMVNTAVTGGVPWVRLNNAPPNQTYTLDALPPMLPDSMDKQQDQLIAEYAKELFAR